MKITSTTLKQIAAMPVEAMAVSLLFLAGQLEQHERKQVAAAERQSRWRNAHKDADVTPMSRESNADVTPLARVVDTTLSSLTLEGSKEKGNLTVSQKALPSKPLPPEPKGFAEFFETYPRRAGGNARPAAVKCFRAQINRGVPFETIMDGARRYRAHCDAEGKTGTQFVYKARTWLNDSGWNETYETARTNHKHNTIAGGFDIIDRAIAEGLAAEERLSGSEGDTQHIPRLLKIAS